MSSDMDEIVQEFLVESYEALDRLDGDLLGARTRPQLPRRAREHLPRDAHDQRHLRLPRLPEARTRRPRGRIPARWPPRRHLGGEPRDHQRPPVDRRRLAQSARQGRALRQRRRPRLPSPRGHARAPAQLGRAPTPPPTCRPPPRRLASARPPRATSRSRRSRPAPLPPAAMPSPAEKASVAETNIRVDVQVLDNLMTLVGELVLARNHIMQLTAGSTHDPPLLSAAAAPQRASRRSCRTA